MYIKPFTFTDIKLTYNFSNFKFFLNNTNSSFIILVELTAIITATNVFKVT